MRVTPGMSPPIMSTTPNSPTVWAKVRTAAVRKDMRESGRVMRRKTVQGEAPRTLATSRVGAIDGGERDDERLHGEGQAVDHRADEKAGEGEGEGMSDEGDEGAAEGGGGAEADEQVEAEHRGRKHQRKRDGCLHDAARQAVARRDPRSQRCRQQQQAERGQAGESQRQAECGEVHGDDSRRREVESKGAGRFGKSSKVKAPALAGAFSGSILLG